MKKKILTLSLLLLLSLFSVQAAETVRIRETQIPILLERIDNALFYIRIDADKGATLNEVKLTLGDEVRLADIRSVKFYYGGTRNMSPEEADATRPEDYISAHRMGHTLAANPSYSVLLDERKPAREMVFALQHSLVEGPNFYWVSFQMSPRATLQSKVTAAIERVTLNGCDAELKYVSGKSAVHRMGVGVRHAGDDGAAAFRIPGLVTTGKGTLLAVYDIRYNSSVDLQEYIEIGVSRSTDGGRTWEKMRIPMSFGEYGGLPRCQNGVGDPSILVDTHTGNVWIVAAWTHGMGNQRAWFNSKPGMDVAHTAQLVLACSSDDGKTWSNPMNITGQVKRPEWHFLLQGPGRGITMEDGTLVFPIQYIGADRIPCAGVMYSKDGGRNWTIHEPARSNTTESQVVELEKGVLMLNMRDNRGGSRAVAVTRDMGKTWEEHPSSRKALRESVCMASLIRVKADENVLGRDILLFSNPDTTKNRNHITIKASLDGGHTWPTEHQVLLDEEESWGYTCLSMIDRETVGILYESSTAHLVFQAVKLKDLIAE